MEKVVDQQSQKKSTQFNRYHLIAKPTLPIKSLRKAILSLLTLQSVQEAQLQARVCSLNF